MDDPSQQIKDAPYTFFVPSAELIKLIEPGDLVKLIFRSTVPRKEWDAEKMWVEFTHVSNGKFFGKLANDPYDMPQLKVGDQIEFEEMHIVDLIISKPERITRVQAFGISSERREFWDRCLVEDCILYEGVKVGYIYREQPEGLEADTEFKDSGWRIRGDGRNMTRDEYDNRKTSFVAVGAVLNKDDSWLHLIDEDVGTAFDRDFETNQYLRSK